ncbi:MAG: hypothetical protein IPK13_06600 [Deltaproteobacteria bacterium]|nr:hypothetical protein [Deltaproteobacteria bacterium]MBK8011002.1 hypothetical protein [Deltaproteobacteria bacterium]MCB9653146.1 hypothetical protein [Deltaproteobacteria bacterium]
MTSKNQQTTGTAAHGRWSEAEARSMLVALERSGQSVVAFARSQGVSAQRIYWWRQRLGPSGRTAVPDDVGLVPVRIRCEDARGLDPVELGAPVIVVRSVGGVVIEVPRAVSPGWIAALTRDIEDR